MSRLPVGRDGALTITPDATPLPVGTPDWFAWLCAARSFTFNGTAGTFTACHETRSGCRFWYPYRHQDRHPPGCPIARPAIVVRCVESAARPCAVIAAPPGFGKTTVLLLTCAQLAARAALPTRR
jgi:hypothetical protein